MGEHYEDYDLWKLFFETLLLAAEEKEKEEEEKKNTEKIVKEEKKEKEEKEKIKNKEVEPVVKNKIDYEPLSDEKEQDEFLQKFNAAMKKNSDACTKYNESIAEIARLINEGITNLRHNQRESQWIPNDNGATYNCDNCKHEVWVKTRYCCECGCKMKNPRTMMFGA